MKKYIFFLSFAIITCCGSCKRSGNQIASPNGKVAVEYGITDGAATYIVTLNGETFMEGNRLGFDNHTYEFVSSQTSSFSEKWETTWGEQREIDNTYNQLEVLLKDETGEQLKVVFRVFDEGYAFRYEFPGEGEFALTQENTTYNLCPRTQTWSIPWDTPYYEGLWEKSALENKSDTLCSPLTFEFADGSYGFLHEAALEDFAAQNFYYSLEDGALHTYLTPLKSGIAVKGQRGVTKSSWRMFVIADDITALSKSRMILNLNDPCKIEDTSWIHPMKFIGIWWAIHLDHYSWCYRLLDENGDSIALAPHHGATTENMKRYIDFAAEHGFGGVLAEGWNEGWDGDWTSNLASFTTPTPDFDINYLSKYAQEKGVQIIGHHETGGNISNYEAQLEDALRFYDTLGIHNVKTGYVHAKLEGDEWHKSQFGVRHMNHVIRTAAANHVCIDNHECVMPTGLCRTYPNLMTGEGVRGQEWDAWSTDGGSPAQHLCVLPFTRCMAGPVDFTPGTFDFSNPVHPETRVHSTLARQLALFVVVYSPLQMASDMPESYMQHPEAFRFIEQVPCDWEQSFVQDAVIGDYVITVRQDRNSNDWYIGAITDEEERKVNIDLSFLQPNKHYKAEVYRDVTALDISNTDIDILYNPSYKETGWVSNPYAIVLESFGVTANSTLDITLKSAGGAAIRITELAE